MRMIAEVGAASRGQRGVAQKMSSRARQSRRDAPPAQPDDLPKRLISCDESERTAAWKLYTMAYRLQRSREKTFLLKHRWTRQVSASQTGVTIDGNRCCDRRRAPRRDRLTRTDSGAQLFAHPRHQRSRNLHQPAQRKGSDRGSREPESEGCKGPAAVRRSRRGERQYRCSGDADHGGLPGLLLSTLA